MFCGEQKWRHVLNVICTDCVLVHYFSGERDVVRPTRHSRNMFFPLLASRSALARFGLGKKLLAPASSSGITSAVHCKHTLPDLPYDFNALEPYISADIMKLHHQKHHATYVTNLNIAEEKLSDAVTKGDTSTIIGLQPALKFNGGGHLNHSIFWEVLSPHGGGEPEGELMEAIIKDFGSFEKMKNALVNNSVAVQGSGWGWLGYDTASKQLKIATCANQDPLKATTGLVPLFGIDVWEHAYYLQYKNVRPDYVKAIFHIANWKNVAERFSAAQAS